MWGPHFLYLLDSENSTEVSQLPQPPSRKSLLSPRQRFSSWLGLGWLRYQFQPAASWKVPNGPEEGGKAGRKDLTLRLLIGVYGPGLCPVKGRRGDGPMHLFLSDIPVLAVRLPEGMHVRPWREGAHRQRGLIPSCTAPSSPGHSTAHSSCSPHPPLFRSPMSTHPLAAPPLPSTS